MSPGLRRKLVAILSSVFQVLILSTKEIRRGRFKSYFKRLIGSESPVQPALDRLKALTQGEGLQVIADAYGNVAQISTKQDQMQDLVSQMNESVQGLRKEHRERTNLAHQDKLREILEPSPFPEDYYTSFNKSRVDGTGDWLLQDEGLQAWLQGETRFLWMNGGPGTGKSFLTTRLISWGFENLPNLAYFYFRDNDPETRSVLQALRDVAYQLSETDAFYAKELLSKLHSGDEIRTVASAYRKLFVQPCQEDTQSKTMFVFLDGIDEADRDDIEELFKQLAEEDDMLQDEAATRIQFALVGRSHMETAVTWTLDQSGHGQITTIQISPDKTFGDVRAYIVDEVFRSRVLSRTSVDFKHEVIEAMENKVAGLFILAKFMLAEVNRKRHPKSILQSLETYPKEINGMLQTTMANLAGIITEEEAADLNEMLRWIACAEETLTLEQLEAALVLRFGDPPVRLEEALRGQYACFFELEREDGLTTDDLLKDFERTQRQFKRDLSPATRGSTSGRRRFSSASNSPNRRGSPIGIIINTSPHSSPTSSPRIGQLSPPQRPFSPARSPDFWDSVNELEFRSNKATTYVSFFHSSVRQFFRTENSLREAPSEVAGAAGLGIIGGEHKSIGFDTLDAKIHILRTCLRIFIEKDWLDSQELEQGKDAIRQYAAWYWQEHLAILKLGDVDATTKSEIGGMVYKMLTEDETILNWSLMYEKGNEGLEVLTDKNITTLQRWLADFDVTTSIDSDGKAWAKDASASASALAQPMGRLYAKAWLLEGFNEYIPTKFCFKIVQSVACLSDTCSWSDSGRQWSVETTLDRIAKAAEWAKMPETAHWHRRVGSTFLILGLYSEALRHYDEALDMDSANAVLTNGRIAFCLTKDKRWGEALDRALDCAAMEEQDISSGKHKGPALTRSRWRLYKDYFLIAQCYYELRELDNSLKYFRIAVESSQGAKLSISEMFEPHIGYLDVLAAENRHDDVVQLLQTMATQQPRRKHSRDAFVDLLLDQYNKPLVMDWIPRAACRAGAVDFLFEGLEAALTTTVTTRDPLRSLFLRLSLGALCTYARRTDDAIGIYENISLLEYRPRGNVPTRQGHAISFQKLASLYKQKVLQAGLKTADGEDWLEKLEDISEKQGEHQNLDMPPSMLGSDVNVASIFLSLFYRLLGRQHEANVLLKALVMDSLDLLSDADPQNDAFALDNLVRIFLAADDEVNARALAHSMRRVNPLASMSTPADSPVSSRRRWRAGAEPKLPEIQSAGRICASCLNNISLAEDVAICKFCLDFFCEECLAKIKSTGVQVQERGREKVLVGPAGPIESAMGRVRVGDEEATKDLVCRNDHEWMIVPPLDKFLHTGEILFDNGVVRGFTEWREELQSMWEQHSPIEPRSALR